MTACAGGHGIEIREGWFVSVCAACGTRADLAVTLRDSFDATRREAREQAADDVERLIATAGVLLLDGRAAVPADALRAALGREP